MVSSNLSSYRGTHLICSCCVWITELPRKLGRRRVRAGQHGSTASGWPPPGPAVALTFRCGFAVLYFGLKGHCISICILLLFLVESYAIEVCLHTGTPDSLRTHSQLMPRVSVGLLLCLLRQLLHLLDLHSWPPLACFCLVSNSVSIRTDLECEQPCIRPLDKKF